MADFIYDFLTEATPGTMPPFDNPSDWTYDEEFGVQVMVLGPITSSTGLKGIMLDIIGPYDGIVTQYRYMQNSSTNYTYVNDVQPDYPWLFSAGLFIVLIWSLFMIGGRLLRTR